jgi:hypothetical protein
MLPGRLGLRFALEALFLVLLAIGAGLADLRPVLIVLVMAAAWVLVAIAEYTAERISVSPASYLLPPRAAPAEGEPEPVSWPMPEERTIVAPPEQRAEPEPEPKPEPAPRPQTPEPVAEEPAAKESAEAEPPPEETPAEQVAVQAALDDTLGLPLRQRLRSRLRRREREEDAPPAPPPRHVKLLPRRSSPEPSGATQEVAELFGEDAKEREEERA